MHEVASRAVWMLIHLPEMEVHARGKNCKHDELEIIKKGLVGVLEEQRCEDVRY